MDKTNKIKNRTKLKIGKKINKLKNWTKMKIFDINEQKF